eukprot:TRINITY_DN4372_c0_g1_i1.p1 TRINITY_DN4372_c0_g1~~TRINITY_DN4372_c0_g1_i1.p1  ORF type:complete len:131 (-),score=37.58 TRINITY_DN4372_c0_g1_i1:43-435(-)
MSSKDPMCKYEITAVSGNVWVSTDRDGLSDPYIVMKKKGLLGKTLFETPVVNDSMSPVWNFTEVITARKNTTITVKLMDKDPIGSNTIGVASFKLNGTQDFAPMSFSPSLEKEDTVTGLATIKIWLLEEN